MIGKDAAKADATVTIPRAVFEQVVLGQRSMADAIKVGDAAVVGNATRVTQLFGLFDDFDTAFSHCGAPQVAVSIIFREAVAGAVNS